MGSVEKANQKASETVQQEEFITENLALSNLDKQIKELKEFASNLMKNELGKKFISEIKTMKNPPVIIRELMTCICHMLKTEPKIVGYERNREPIIDWWHTSCIMMSQVNFYQKLVDYDNFEQMDGNIYGLLCKSWGSTATGWNLNNFKNQSNASAKLFEWVKCQMDIFALRLRYAHVVKTS